MTREQADRLFRIARGRHFDGGLSRIVEEVFAQALDQLDPPTDQPILDP